MTHVSGPLVATLVQNGELILPLNVLLGEAQTALGDIELEYRELGPGAVDIHLSQNLDAADQLQNALLAQLPNHVDVCVQPVAGRQKKLLICDMDSTVIGQECIDELADYAGIRDRIAQITERAMQGELDFETALTERVALLTGLSVSTLQACYDQRITLTPGARTLVQTMKALGAKTLLVSGGFTFFTSRVAKASGFEENYANILLDDGKELTGKVQPPILGKQAKLDRLNEAVQKLGIGLTDAVTIGDGANDSAMIEAAGLGLGFNPHPILAAKAKAVISGPSLATALYFQGVTRERWTD